MDLDVDIIDIPLLQDVDIVSDCTYILLEKINGMTYTGAVGAKLIPDFNRSRLQELIDTCSQIRSVLKPDKTRSHRKKVR
jgi:hypothetical protein